MRDRVQEALAYAGLRPADIDKCFGLSQGYFAKVLRGEKKVTPRIVAEIALLTGVDQAWIEEGGGPLVPAEKGTKSELSPEKRPIRYTCYKCWRCMGLVEEPAQVCRHCGAALRWREWRQRAEDVALHA
jgi:hypothetical protein